jgi:hypothetical protein
MKYTTSMYRLFVGLIMRHLFLASIVLMSVSAGYGYRLDTGIKNKYQKPGLPLNLQFNPAIPDPIRFTFRQQLAERGIDTISTEQAIRLITAELSERMETARRNNSSFRNTPPQPKFFMTMFNIVMNEQHQISRISWRAYAMPNSRPDTSSKYYLVPDSLQMDAVKAISGCIDAMIKTRVFR